MPSYKLTYFNVRGFAEMSRLIFEYAKQPYEDVRVDHADWPNLKAKTPFGQLPVLEVDGKPLAQSCAIARYLARKFNLAGKDEFEQAYVDSIADLQKDLYSKLAPVFGAVTEGNESDREALKASVFTATLEQYMPIFERLLKESGSGFFAKSGVTWASLDFSLINDQC
jgi:glutathione S-transferase